MSGSSSSARSVIFGPLACAILGGVLTVGTVVGQDSHGRDDTEGVSPMAGMDHSGGAMAGMDHSGGAMAGMDHSGGAMAGMDHSGGAMAGMDHSGGAMAGMDHSDGAMPEMDLSVPGMAAMMTGGVHTECAAADCTLIFAKDASGAASFLGMKAGLSELTAKSATLVVDGKKLVLRPGKAMTLGGVTFSITRIDSTEVAVHAVKKPG